MQRSAAPLHCLHPTLQTSPHLLGNCRLRLVHRLAACDHFRVVSRKGQCLVHLQSALVVLQRLLVLVKLAVKPCNVVERLSNVGVVALEQGLTHAQRALQVLQRLFVLAQFDVRCPNVVERLSNVGVVALEQCLEHA